MNRRRSIQTAAIASVLALAAGLGVAQLRRSDVHTARDIPSETETPAEWKIEPGFKKDVFTFVRIKYTSWGRRWANYGGWATDVPDSDLNFSYRLQQMTSIKVDPNGRLLELTDPELFNYPWIYIVEPGWLIFNEDEVAALRKYLLNGGFLMVDDFWGERQWRNFYEQIKRVFPEREPEDLEMEHEIFNCVFPLKQIEKNKMQVPNYETGERSRRTGVTWESHDGEECRDVHFRAIFDDKRRMMVMICHNTDNGDGWEREGIYHYYFREFSEKIAYPLGINIVFYAMTH